MLNSAVSIQTAESHIRCKSVRGVDLTANSAAREALILIARRWVALGWQRGDAEGVLARYAPDFVDLGHPSGRPGTAAENVAGLRELYAAFPDFTTTIADLIVDEVAGSGAVRWSATGTHRGMFFGAEPTGRQITFAGIETLRVRDGLIIERTGEWDGLSLLRQLGIAARF